MYEVEIMAVVISVHDKYDDALEAARAAAGPDAVIGHDGDLSEGGDRTLIWDCEQDAENDPGANAIGSIRVAGD